MASPPGPLGGLAVSGAHQVAAGGSMKVRSGSWSRLCAWAGRVVRAARQFLYGMTAYEFERHALEQRTRLEDLFVLITLGDLIGLPILPPYYSLRLLPYAIPRLTALKRRMLRERHTLENEEYDLIEL